MESNEDTPLPTKADPSLAEVVDSALKKSDYPLSHRDQYCFHLLGARITEVGFDKFANFIDLMMEDKSILRVKQSENGGLITRVLEDGKEPSSAWI